jgi:hypothetical protein
MSETDPPVVIAQPMTTKPVPSNLPRRAIYVWGEAFEVIKRVWPWVLLAVLTILLTDQARIVVGGFIPYFPVTYEPPYWLVWLNWHLPFELVFAFAVFVTSALVWMKVLSDPVKPTDPVTLSPAIIGRLAIAYFVQIIATMTLNFLPRLLPPDFGIINFGPFPFGFYWMPAMIQNTLAALFLFLIPLALAGQPKWLTKSLMMGWRGLFRRIVLVTLLIAPLSLIVVLTSTASWAAAEQGHSIPFTTGDTWPEFVFWTLVFQGIWVVALASLAKVELAALAEAPTQPADQASAP